MALLTEGVSDGRGANADYAMQACTLESGSAAVTQGLLPPEDGNWGGSRYLMSGRGLDRLYRSLVQFDLSALSDRMVSIQSARLVLTFYKINELSMVEPIPDALEVQLYRIGPANAGWLEGPSALGERAERAACWRERATGEDGWAGEGGCGLAEVDREAEPLVTVILDKQALSRGREVVFEFADPAFLEEWVLNDSRNTGFLIQSVQLEEAMSDRDIGTLVFNSDDAVDVTARPRLEIEYVSRVKESVYREGDDTIKPETLCQTQVTTLVAGDDRAYGADPLMWVGALVRHGVFACSRGLLKFDVSDLASQVKTLDEVRLEMYVDVAGSTLAGQTDPLDLALYRLSPENADWVEGETALSPVAARWACRVGAQIFWAGGVGAGAGVSVPDIDYVSTPVAVAQVDPSALAEGKPVIFIFKSFDFLNCWIRDEAGNAGFKLECAMLEDATEAIDGATVGGVIAFHSDDAVDPALRPKLVVRYFKFDNASAEPDWTLWE